MRDNAASVQINRRALLGAALAASVATPLALRAQPKYTLKYATNVIADNPLNIRLAEAFSRIKQETNGAVVIELFPNGQLGSDTDMLSQLRSGALDMMTLSSVILSTLVPSCAIVGVGFAFPSYDAIWAAMDGNLGERLRADIAKAGLYAQPRIWDLSFKELTSSKGPIRTPEDLKGFKLRVPPGPLWTSLFKAFDAAPTTINMNEAYSALQTKIVDGTELPLTTFYYAKLYEVQKYISLSRHMWDGWWSLSNRKMWEGLPQDVRAVIAKHLDQSALDHRADIARVEASLVKELSAKGMQIIDIDQKPFRAKLQAAGFYKEWKGRFAPELWQTLEKYTGAIA
jgi:tripartite ATP-independent transporter DctP family solute receptor